MRYIITIIIALMLVSCEGEGGKNDVPGTDGYLVKYEFEGHEYLIYDGYYSGAMLHSASCPCGRGGR